MMGGHRGLLRVENFQFFRPIKLPRPIATPLGSRVTVVCPYVDVDYRVVDGGIRVEQVRMARAGTTILGSAVRLNITAEKTGEAFYVAAVSPHSLLTDYVMADVQNPRGQLRRIMYGKWRVSCPSEVRQALVDALNRQLPSEQIRQLIGNAGVLGTVAFTYESPKRGAEERAVMVHSVHGESLQATDQKDAITKTFRLDRISNARPA